MGVGGEERLQERVGGRRGRELLEAAGERGEDVGAGERACPVDAGGRQVAYGEEEWRRRGVVLLSRVGVGGGHWCRASSLEAGRGGWRTRGYRVQITFRGTLMARNCFSRLVLGLFTNYQGLKKIVTNC